MSHSSADERCGRNRPERRYAARVLLVRNRQEAAALLVGVGADPRGVERMLPKALHYLVSLADVPVRAAMLLKQSMLARGGDAAISWQASNLSAERTGVVMMGTARALREAMETLKEQPFGLPGLAAEAADALEAFTAVNPGWCMGDRCYDLSRRTLVMGILNVTPDSFSDGGLFFDTGKAIEHALQMAEEGADIIDIGGESTRLGAEEVAPEEEIRRLVPVIEGLTGAITLPISVDTRKSRVAAAAMAAGASIINDVSGLDNDPDMPAVAAATGASLVLMHARGNPRTMQQKTDYTDLMGEISAFLYHAVDRAVCAGVPEECIAVDPGIGIGFAKERRHNLEIIRRLGELRSLGRPVLVGASRKAFIGAGLQLSPGERLEGTSAVNALAVAGGASVLRVHDVRSAVRVCRMAEDILYGAEVAGS